MGGDYTLTVRGETPTAAGTFSFIVHGVDDTASTLALDAVDTRSLSGVGATHAFDLTLAEAGPVRLYFGIAGLNQLSYRIIDALGNPRGLDHFRTGGDRTGAPGNRHPSIEVRGRSGYDGEFSLQVRP